MLRLSVGTSYIQPALFRRNKKTIQLSDRANRGACLFKERGLRQGGFGYELKVVVGPEGPLALLAYGRICEKPSFNYWRPERKPAIPHSAWLAAAQKPAVCSCAYFLVNKQETKKEHSKGHGKRIGDLVPFGKFFHAASWGQKSHRCLKAGQCCKKNSIRFLFLRP